MARRGKLHACSSGQEVAVTTYQVEFEHGRWLLYRDRAYQAGFDLQRDSANVRTAGKLAEEVRGSIRP